MGKNQEFENVPTVKEYLRTSLWTWVFLIVVWCVGYLDVFNIFY